MRTLLKIVIALYFALLLIAARNLVRGETTPVVTLAFYSSLLFFIHLTGFAANKFLFSSASLAEIFNKIRLVFFSVVIALMVSDMLLLYMVRPDTYLTYPERNGAYKYYSSTLRQKFEVLRPYLLSHYKMRWPFVNKPNKIVWKDNGEFSYVHQFNSEGLRTGETDITKKQNEIRLLMLGDSFTEGVGAPQDSTWSSLLEDLLQSQESHTAYTVINAGVSGSDPFFETNLLQTRMLKYRPDVVVMAVNRSDVDEVMQRGGYERFKKDSTYVIRDSPWWEPFYGASMILRIFMHNVYAYTHFLMTREQEQQLRNQSQPRMAEAIDEFIRLSRVNHFKPVLVFHPMLLELEQESFPLTPLVCNFKATEDVCVINLYNDYREFFKNNHINPAEYYWRKDLHHNSKGYHLWSGMVYKRLQEKKWIN